MTGTGTDAFSDEAAGARVPSWDRSTFEPSSVSAGRV
jgi:hypothetical protein